MLPPPVEAPKEENFVMKKTLLALFVAVTTFTLLASSGAQAHWRHHYRHYHQWHRVYVGPVYWRPHHYHRHWRHHHMRRHYWY